MSAQPIALTDDELRELTGYSRPAYQIRILKALGIPARRRPDNSVLVMRMHCTTPVSLAANDAPKLKPKKR